MRTETFISTIFKLAQGGETLDEIRQEMPLGLDMAGLVAFGQKNKGMVSLKHTCVTGERRVDCICNLLITLSCLYEKEEANFIIFSPHTKYAELLGLRNMDVIVPYVRTKEELEALQVGLRDLLNLHSNGGKGYPRLFLIVDGLEELPNANVNGEMKEYFDLFSKLLRRPNVEVISGVDFMQSIYSGCPGAFVGIGNCIVTTRKDGKADVTYVGEDTNLSTPILIEFPSEPSIAEMVQMLNDIPAWDSPAPAAYAQPQETVQETELGIENFPMLDDIFFGMHANVKTDLDAILSGRVNEEIEENMQEDVAEENVEEETQRGAYIETEEAYAQDDVAQDDVAEEDVAEEDVQEETYVEEEEDIVDEDSDWEFYVEENSDFDENE